MCDEMDYINFRELANGFRRTKLHKVDSNVLISAIFFLFMHSKTLPKSSPFLIPSVFPFPLLPPLPVP